MSKAYTSILPFLILFLLLIGCSKKCLTIKPVSISLQPSNNPNEFEFLFANGKGAGGTGTPDIPVEAWTSGGTPFTVREAIKFDLSSIPANATIDSAHLYLYSYPTPTLNGNFVDANFGSDNSMLIQEISSNWSPTTASWSNQPSVSRTNQVIVPSTTASQLDLNEDVKTLVSDMIKNNTNYGFFFKIQTEVTYNCRIFVSSYNTTYPDKHPKLVIGYH